MCFDLYTNEALFREEADRCFAVVNKISGKDLKPLIFSGEEDNSIDNTQFTQPALFIIGYSLARLLMSWGIRPDVMIGHSFGEYVAACISGVFTLEDALLLVTRRGELMQQVTGGATLAVAAPESELCEALKKHESISLAAVNSAGLCVVSGNKASILNFQSEITSQKGYASTLVSTTHAFHSPMMDEILPVFGRAFDHVTLNRQQIPFISNLSGTPAQDKDVTTARYWVSHLRHTVRFFDGIETLMKNSNVVFLEVGPGIELCTFVRATRSRSQGHKVINTVRHPNTEGNDQYHLLTALGKLWQNGIEPDWRSFYKTERRRRVSLPTYAFDRVKFPVRKNFTAPSTSPEAPVRLTDISKWFYIPTWKTSPLLLGNGAHKRSCTLLFTNNHSIGQLLMRRFRLDHQEVVYVKKGKHFRKESTTAYRIDPTSAKDHQALFERLASGNMLPDRIIHAWAIDKKASRAFAQKNSPAARDRYLYSIIHTVKAAHRHGSLAERQFVFLTNDLHAITGDEDTAPTKSIPVGMLKVMAQEYPSVCISHIDISLSGHANKRFIDSLYNEIVHEEAGKMVALRHSKRWIQDFDALKSEGAARQKPVNLKDRGVYFITGGLGSLGSSLSEYLLKNFNARVVLTGRTQLPPRNKWDSYLEDARADKTIKSRISRIQKLESTGGEIMYLACDSSLRSEMVKAVKTAERKFGRINGVIHAAGIIEGRSINSISMLEEKDFEDQFASKITGLHVLYEVMKNRPPDFCIITSSLSPILGGLDLAAYASANSYIEHFVNFHRERSGLNNWVCANIDGLSLDKEGRGIHSHEIHEVFERILSVTHLPQVIVSVGDLHKRLRQWVKRPPQREEATNTTAETPSGAEHLAASIETRMKSLWQNFFGKADLDADDDFFELGGDSLKAVTLAGRIYKEFNIEVPIKALFNNATIGKLLQYLGASSGDGRAINSRGYTSIPVAPVKESYPVSSVQRRLYFLYELDKSSTAYNQPLALKIEGNIDKDKLADVFKKLIDRHESLRTWFVIEGEEPRQRISGHCDFTVEIHQPSEHAERTIRKFIRPFDLSQAPLMRVGLVKIASSTHILMIDMHHIITDAVSRSVLVKDFMALYNDQELPSLKLQYKDYAEWCQAYEQQSELEAQKQFWLDEFRELPSATALPTDFTRPSVRSYEGNSFDFALTREETHALVQLAGAEHTTMFTVMLSAYYILIGKLASLEDVVIGTITAGRQHPDLENIMGMFVNTIPVRCYPDGNVGFRTFLSSVKSKVLSCFENQSYSYAALIDALKVERIAGRNPLFDVLFSYRNYEKTALEIPGLAISTYSDSHNVSNFDLTLTAQESGQQVLLKFEYSTELFKRETIERFAGYFMKIVSAIVKNADTRISDIGIISDAEEHQLLNEFNNTLADFPREETIVSCFEKQAGETPQNTAVLYGHSAMTYQELNDTAGKIASHLMTTHGVKAGDLVAVMLEREAYLIPAIFGILKAGGAYVPIDPNYPADRVNAILEDSKPRTLITRARHLEKLDLSISQFIDLDEALSEINLRKTEVSGKRISSNALAYVIYTSGSTGKPKGVAIEHHSVVNRILWMQKAFPINQGDVLLQKTPVAFDVSVWELFWWSFTGASLRLLEPGDEKRPEAIIRAVRESKVTTMHFVPSMLGVFLQVLKEGHLHDLHSLRTVFASGEALKPEHVRAFGRSIHRHCRTRLVNLYGPTEATVDVSYYECDFKNEQASVPIGKPIDNTRLYVLDRNMHLVPVGVPGELYLSGEGLAREYLHNRSLTAEKFIDHPFAPGQKIYRTGDLAKWLPDGNVEFLGRLDDQVKIRGFRIELGEIEHLLSAHEQVQTSAVVVKQQGEDKFLAAYYVSKQEIPASELRDHLSASLPDYMVPACYTRLDKIPLTPNGKMNRKALPEPVITANDQYVAPSNEIEKKLVDIWSGILKIDRSAISVNSDFFKLGGHSLRAIALMNEIREELKEEVQLHDIFTKQNVGSLAEYIITMRQLKGRQDTGAAIQEVTI